MKRLRSENGQAMVEYAALFAAVVIVAAITFGNMSEAAVKIFNLIQNSLLPVFP
ncbi:Flp family type IVb pilin [Lacrimispora xylanisolvens]|uniref:Flp family type IVb pilin n=1 Tax=Lacrimispora xylanisolvens TaxID=384636 RepID=UPI0024028B7F